MGRGWGAEVSGHQRIRISDLHFDAIAFTGNLCLFSYTKDVLRGLAVPANNSKGLEPGGGHGVRPPYPSRSPLTNLKG